MLVVALAACLRLRFCFLCAATLWWILRAADPQQSIQFDPGSGSRLRVESVSRIHDCTNFTALCGSSQCG